MPRGMCYNVHCHRNSVQWFYATCGGQQYPLTSVFSHTSIQIVSGGTPSATNAVDYLSPH